MREVRVKNATDESWRTIQRPGMPWLVLTVWRRGAREPLRYLVPLLLIGCAPLPAHAGPWHYIKTHKTVLLSDALTGAAIMADAASSVHCQNVAPQTCIETGGIGFGRHPSAALTYGEASGWVAAFTVAHHLIWHFAPDPQEGRTQAKVVLGMLTAPILIDEAFNVPSNVRTAERLSGARRRLR